MIPSACNRRPMATFLRNIDLESTISRREAKALDELQVAIDLMHVIRKVANFMREARAAKFLRLTGAQRNAGQVANVARDVRRLAE